MPIKVEHRCGHKKTYELREGRIAGAMEFFPLCRCTKCIKSENIQRKAAHAFVYDSEYFAQEAAALAALETAIMASAVEVN